MREPRGEERGAGEFRPGRRGEAARRLGLFRHQQLLERPEYGVEPVVRNLESPVLRLGIERGVLRRRHLDPAFVAHRDAGDGDEVAVGEREDRLRGLAEIDVRRCGHVIGREAAERGGRGRECLRLEELAACRRRTLEREPLPAVLDSVQDVALTGRT